MKPLAVASLITLAAACGLRDKDGGTSDDANAGRSCADLAALLHARAAAVSRDCAGPDECAAVGFPTDQTGSPTCNCGVVFASSCGGDPVNLRAWTGDPTAQALAAEWSERCVALGAASGAPTLCDCGPGAVGCVDRRCTTTVHDCFVLDAGAPPSP